MNPPPTLPKKKKNKTNLNKIKQKSKTKQHIARDSIFGFT